MGYCDIDWADNFDIRKSTSAKVEYIVFGSSCSQLIWMKSMLQDYSVTKDDATSNMTLYCDNSSAINISKNLVQHLGTKHIDIQHHLFKVLSKKVIELKHVPMKHQLIDIFTKGLDASWFETLCTSLGLCIQ